MEECCVMDVSYWGRQLADDVTRVIVSGALYPLLVWRRLEPQE